MSVAKRRRGELTMGRIVSDANPSKCGRSVHGANRPGVESSRGRIDYGTNRPEGETSMGRNVCKPHDGQKHDGIKSHDRTLTDGLNATMEHIGGGLQYAFSGQHRCEYHRPRSVPLLNINFTT